MATIIDNIIIISSIIVLLLLILVVVVVFYDDCAKTHPSLVRARTTFCFDFSIFFARP